jgi:hypothetical protein
MDSRSIVRFGRPSAENLRRVYRTCTRYGCDRDRVGCGACSVGPADCRITVSLSNSSLPVRDGRPLALPRVPHLQGLRVGCTVLAACKIMEDCPSSMNARAARARACMGERSRRLRWASAGVGTVTVGERPGAGGVGLRAGRSEVVVAQIGEARQRAIRT